jgi:hypothetical protein
MLSTLLLVKLTVSVLQVSVFSFRVGLEHYYELYTVQTLDEEISDYLK